MRNVTKQRMFALFIMLVFGGSTLAFAVEFALQPEKKPQMPDVVERPLTDSEEAPYLQQNYLVVRYFYSSNCRYCAFVEDSIKGLRDEAGSVLLERVSVDVYPNETESVGVTEVPSIYLKGSSTRLLTGAVTYDELFAAACQLYFNPPLACG